MRDRLFQRQLRHIEIPRERSDLAELVGAQITREMGGLLPPFAIHLPEPEALAACWAIVREPAVGPAVARSTKEAVAATVSIINECPYCVDVHTTTLYAFAQSDLGAKVAAGRHAEVTDPHLRAILAWARASRSPASRALADPPFGASAAAELIGTVLGYHYINRMVSIFLPGSLLPGAANGWVAGGLKRLIGAGMRRMLLRSASPGMALQFLPDIEGRSTGEFSWATGDPIISSAFHRAGAIFDTLGAHALAVPVRDLVTERLDQWRGEHPALSRRWVDDAVAGLAEALRPAARFALLSALAPYQIDAQIVGDFQAAVGPNGDERIVAAAAWSAFAAVRRINQWLPAPRADSR